MTAEPDFLEATLADLRRQIASLSELTDAKFVTFRTLVDSQAEKVALALAAADKAVTKAETAFEKRLEAINEFRAVLTDQQHRLITREEVVQRTDALAARLADLAARLDKIEGRAGGMDRAWTAGMAVVVILISVVTVVVSVVIR